MLETLTITTFPKNGYELCKLQRHDIIDLIGNKRTANVLYQHLTYLKKGLFSKKKKKNLIRRTFFKIKS
jgi:hypothetical protein